MKLLIGCILVVCIILFAFIIPNLKTPEEIGLIGNKLAPVPSSPNAVSSQTEQIDKYVEPLILHESVKDSQDKIIDVLTEMGCEIVTRSEVYIHAIDTSNLFHFRDDLEFFFDEDEGLIHFRSASRVGYSDLGINRDRYLKLSKFYNLR